ncbi:hypothetical protein C8J57DRAFT_1274569 [Mycena rebaudengoi]|nr:hypothetical protein C8J57DRAFT_1274569 [Mycena rebaudengoi]
MRFLFTTAFWFFFVSSLLSYVVGESSQRDLVPFKRRSTSSILSRAWKRELVPKRAVELYYGLETASYPSTALKFKAHSATPIILLEDIEDLVDNIFCHSPPGEKRASVELNFRFKDAYLEALRSWSSHASFILVTSHLTCNLDLQRGAWVITGVEGHKNYPQIKLEAESLPMREMGDSFHISHTANGASSWGPSQGLDARAFDKVSTFTHDLGLAPRQQLFPIDIGLLQRSNSEEIRDVSTTAGLQVFCVDCVSRTNFSVGLELDVTNLGTTINQAHINITVEEFEHNVQLEFSLDGSVTFSKSVDVIRAPLPDLGITIPEIGSVGFFYGGAVSAELEIAGGLNFSIGAKTQVPPGATATFVMAGDGNSSATGWDKASFELIPFRLNGGSFNATTRVSLSPFLEAEFSLTKLIAASARIAVNTPRLTASASLQANVNRKCEAIGPTDFESFSAALSFGAEASLHIQTTTNGTLLPDTDTEIFAFPVKFPTFPSPDAPACFIITDDGLPGLKNNALLSDLNNAEVVASPTLAGVPAATGTLLSAASAVPTFDIPKIEAFLSSAGTLPTNVNYSQMAQATTIPDNLKAALNKIAHGGGERAEIPRAALFVVGLISAICACNV